MMKVLRRFTKCFFTGRRSTCAMSRKFIHPAAERNKEPILSTLARYLDGSKPATLLEISSGSGQHVAHIAPHFPNINFLPTEYDERNFTSIKCHVLDSGLTNVEEPRFLDVRQPWSSWLDGSLKPNSVDYVLNINMMHISEWSCAQGLFVGCGRILKPGGHLFTYGPYSDNGLITPESNVRFDSSLRAQDSSWGLRDITQQLVPLAAENSIILSAIHDLPANNKLLVWTKHLEEVS